MKRQNNNGKEFDKNPGKNIHCRKFTKKLFFIILKYFNIQSFE